MEVRIPEIVIHFVSLCPPLQRSWKGGILVSPCPSVRLWTESCPLCIFNNTHRIHFIFAHLIKQFWRIFLICNFDFVFFWLGIQYDSMLWVIIRRRGVSSERRRSSCNSIPGYGITINFDTCYGSINVVPYANLYGKWTKLDRPTGLLY